MTIIKKNDGFDRSVKDRIALFEGRSERGAAEVARKRNEDRKEYHRKASRKHYYKDVEKSRARGREHARNWRRNHPEKAAAQAKAWNHRHPDKRRALNNAAYRRHAEEYRLAAAIKRHRENPAAPYKGRYAEFGSVEALEAELERVRKEKTK